MHSTTSPFDSMKEKQKSMEEKTDESMETGEDHSSDGELGTVDSAGSDIENSTKEQRTVQGKILCPWI